MKIQPENLEKFCNKYYIYPYAIDNTQGYITQNGEPVLITKSAHPVIKDKDRQGTHQSIISISRYNKLENENNEIIIVQENVAGFRIEVTNENGEITVTLEDAYREKDAREELSKGFEYLENYAISLGAKELRYKDGTVISKDEMEKHELPDITAEEFNDYVNNQPVKKPEVKE